MSLQIISFTEKGAMLASTIYDKMEQVGMEVPTVFTKASVYKEKALPLHTIFAEQSLADWTRERMEQKHAILFIGACGIAVRAIAPCVVNKLEDGPVLVMEETGSHVIPILSGHVGGANLWASLISGVTGAEAVITTATDLNGKFAVDLFAKRNHLHIVNKDGIAKVSAKVLQEKEITISVEQAGCVAKHPELALLQPDLEGVRLVTYPPTESVDVLVSNDHSLQASIYLSPKEYVIGMGCKKGKSPKEIEQLIKKTLQEIGLSIHQMYALASIDVKKEEEGFLAFSSKERIPFLVYSSEELKQVQGEFHTSSFVETQVGVDNVCERAALKACGEGGQLIYEKHAADGMTIAVAKRRWSVMFDEK